MGSFRPSPRPSSPFLSHRASFPVLHLGLCAALESSTCPLPSFPVALTSAHLPPDLPFFCEFPRKVKKQVGGGAGEVTTQTQLGRADSVLGRGSQARAWLVQCAAGYFDLPLLSESVCCMGSHQHFQGKQPQSCSVTGQASSSPKMCQSS